MITSLPTKRISAISQWKTFLRVLATRRRRKPAGTEITSLSPYVLTSGSVHADSQQWTTCISTDFGADVWSCFLVQHAQTHSDTDTTESSIYAGGCSRPACVISPPTTKGRCRGNQFCGSNTRPIHTLKFAWHTTTSAIAAPGAGKQITWFGGRRRTN